MGNGIVFWLLLLNFISASAWFSLIWFNLYEKRIIFASLCCSLMIGFFMVGYINFQTYIVNHRVVEGYEITLRFTTAIFMVIGSTGFACNPSRYLKKKKGVFKN